MPSGTPGTPIIICLGCGQEKPHRAKGLCETCYGRYYYQAHREERLAYSHRWKEEHQEMRAATRRRYNETHQEERAAYNRRRRKENPEREAARNHYWQKENPEKVAARNRRWRRANPEKVAAKLARREARKRNLPNTLTPEQAEQLFAIGQAMYPGERLHLDHIIPLSKGGGTTLANMHYIPASLNCSKQDALPQEIFEQGTLL